MNVRAAWGGLSRGEQAFVLVDVLLVVLMVVLLARLPGGGDRDAAAAPPTPTAGPTTGPTSDAEDGAPESVEPVVFTLPSGNIGCEMSAEGVRCTIGSFTYAPPQVTGCEGETGHVVRLDAEGFGFECEDDGVTRVPADAPELPYGQREGVGDYTCASGTDGVSCTDAAGVGFRLARGQWNALP